jgi:hypothetical protein
MDEVTKENYKKVEDVVLNGNFNLTEESKEKFHYLLWNQVHAPEYSKIEEQPDKRLFIDWTNDCHDAYNSFKDMLPFLDITYENFMNNKTDDGKKLLKYVKEFFSKKENISELGKTYNNLLSGSFTIKTFKALFPKKYKEKENEDLSEQSKRPCFNSDTGKIEVRINIGHEEEQHHLLYKEDISQERYEKKMSDIIDSLISILNTKYISKKDKKKIKLCFSLNFADWILASTKNNWTSCLSLESSYGYWKGLAGLVGDKNRLMIFTTDMKEKEFCGIKSYNMIERMWVFTMERFGTTYLHHNTMYPRKVDFDLSSLKDYFVGEDLSFYNKGDIEANSKYKFPILYHKEGDDENEFSSSIYEDTLAKIPIDKDYACYVQGDDEDDSRRRSVFSYLKKNIVNTDFKEKSIDSIIDDMVDEFYISEAYEHS